MAASSTMTAENEISRQAETDLVVSEFKTWQAGSNNEIIFLLDTTPREEGGVAMNMLLASQHEFQLLCPANYPNHEDNFYVDANPDVRIWANALNEFVLDTEGKLLLTEVLHKAVALYNTSSHDCMEESDNESMEEGEDDDEDMIIDDDDAYTTEWELQVARKKKRWAEKEIQLRAELKRNAAGTAVNQELMEKGQQQQGRTKQIFTSSAASGILTNDLVKIMECEKELGFTVEPIEDNIYKWQVKLFDFDPASDLSKDLQAVEQLFGYKFIELQMDFAIDLYPFYPPLVKVVRPRLQPSMMQRVTNMDLLKLSYWNPAKDMQSILVEIKTFLQQWARLEINSVRNDPKKYPNGSFVDIEHHLLRLALVSEVNPRASFHYFEKPPDFVPAAAIPPKSKKQKMSEEYWERGVGFGHSKRPEWDINTYVAVQREKDKQIESVLHTILDELKDLYAKHAPQLKPRQRRTEPRSQSESIDPVEDMYTILEGSSLVPFLEQYLNADSFLEICRHTVVYKAIIDILKEIARQTKLIPLLCSLPDQQKSIIVLLENLEQKASLLLQHIYKAGNGAIPKPPKGHPEPESEACPVEFAMSAHTSTASAKDDGVAEQRLAREFVNLFKDVKESLSRAGLGSTVMPNSSNDAACNSNNGHNSGINGTNDTTTPSSSSSCTSSSNSAEGLADATPNAAGDGSSSSESPYLKNLKSLQFGSHGMEVEGPGAHHFSTDFKLQTRLAQPQVFRIAQELTSLSSSLPLDLSSSIFVRTDDDKLTLMRALIIGPEGTPYSGGCFQFDIFFPNNYPKTPPLVNFQTTGGGTVRFNPNLYNSGKVCLSLLGTWAGQKGERWNDTTSTVLQVLVSIQSLILVPEPYFNEPGYEQEIGTEIGLRNSDDYNADVRINNIKYAVIAQLQNPTPGFEDVVKTHFFYKKDRILEEYEGWLKQNKSSKLEKLMQTLKKELNKLRPPTPPTTNKSNEENSSKETSKSDVSNSS